MPSSPRCCCVAHRAARATGGRTGPCSTGRSGTGRHDAPVHPSQRALTSATGPSAACATGRQGTGSRAGARTLLRAGGTAESRRARACPGRSAPSGAKGGHEGLLAGAPGTVEASAAVVASDRNPPRRRPQQPTIHGRRNHQHVARPSAMIREGRSSPLPSAAGSIDRRDISLPGHRRRHRRGIARLVVGRPRRGRSVTPPTGLRW